MKSLLLILSVLFAVFCISCTETIVPEVTEKTVTNENVSENEQYRYYSFETDQFILASEATSTKWDMRLPAIQQLGKSRTIDIVFNSSNVNSIGEIVGGMRNQPYSFVKDFDGIFNPDNLLDTSKRIINPYVLGSTENLYFQYSQTIVIPNPNKTVVLKLSNSTTPTWVKLQILSLYKNNPIAPVFTDSLSFYTFRYTKTKGSKF